MELRSGSRKRHAARRAADDDDDVLSGCASSWGDDASLCATSSSAGATPPRAGAAAAGARASTKRPRRGAAAAAVAAAAAAGAAPLASAVHADAEACLYVRRWSPRGARREWRLPLAPIAGVGDLRGLYAALLAGAFGPDGAAAPAYLAPGAGAGVYKFTPAAEWAALPGGAAARTELRVAVRVAGGREATAARRRLGAPPDAAAPLLVTVAEFESDELALPGGRAAVLSLVSYPTVCVGRGALDAAVARARAGAA